ncbi:MAG: YdcF family protein [Lachnospiraceae bacterium]|nr:YdcF family protein [Lachnospiraceae bacterium]
MRKFSFLRIVLLFVGLFGVICFLLPLFIYGIINIGNITGFFVFLCITLYGMKMPAIHRFLKKVWQKRSGKYILSVLSVFIVLALGIATVISVGMIRTVSQEPPKNATVIVLGAKVQGERPSLILQERLDAAYDYLQKNQQSVCILSGGMGSDENISEAECMYQYLIDKGIDSKRLYKEDQSTTTQENLAFSKDLIQQYSLDSTIVIVTNEFHEYRAVAIASSLDMEAYAVPAETLWWLFPTYYVRELYGIVYEYIR